MAAADHKERMDRIHRYERHFYDFTRKCFLFGRDTLLAQMLVESGDQVLQVACGMARNLVKLARRHPEARFYGLDISDEMLKRTRRKAGLSCKIVYS